MDDGWNFEGYGTRATEPESVLLEKDMLSDVCQAADGLYRIIYEILYDYPRFSGKSREALFANSDLDECLTNLKAKCQKLLAMDDLERHTDARDTLPQVAFICWSIGT